MMCLRRDLLDLYLENELDAPSAQEVNRHLDECPKCRQAYEDRKTFFEAARGLADIEVPPGLAPRIMSRLFPAGRQWLVWIAAILAGMSALLLGVAAYAGSSGQNLAGLILDVQKAVWSLVRPISFIAVKCFALIALAAKHLPGVLGKLIEILGRLHFLIRFEILFIGFISVLGLAGLFLALRKNLCGEKP